MDKSIIARLRHEYTQRGLLETDVLKDPIAQFRQWFQEAVEAGLLEPNAMTLATATPDGKPSSRIVLLKDVSDDGFVFFTNYKSRKGRELENNPQAALHFLWGELERQVRIEGVVAKVPDTASAEYFASRPLESQIGAWVSEQSQTIPDRTTLEHRFKELEQKYRGGNVPRPPHWGGYVLKPTELEFWQGRPHRLHDRLLYRRTDDRWTLTRLSP